MNSPVAAKTTTAQNAPPILSQRSDDFGKIAAIEIYQLFYSNYAVLSFGRHHGFGDILLNPFSDVARYLVGGTGHW